MSNEVTGLEVVAIAGRLLPMTDQEVIDWIRQNPGRIRSLFASLVTQAADRERPRRQDTE